MSEAAVRLVGLRKVFGARGGNEDDVVAVDSIDLEVAGRRVLRDARPVGLGQDHRAADDRRLRAADRRRGAPRRPRRHPRRAVRPRRQHGLPGLRAVPAHDGAAERRLRPDGQEGRQARAPASGPTRRWPRCGSRASASGDPASSPAASGSGWRSPAPWSTGPGCCCSTSRSAPSTSSCASRCRSSSRRIQRDVGITFLFVTHDQEEALTMSDRIAVFNRGRIEQVGTAAEVYERPASAFVAGFVGTSNLLQGEPAVSPARRPGAGLGAAREGPHRARARLPRHGPGDVRAEGRSPRSSTPARRPACSCGWTPGAEIAALVQNTGAAGDHRPTAVTGSRSASTGQRTRHTSAIDGSTDASTA